MPICMSCGKSFPNIIKINGISHNLSSRIHCLDCVPFGTRFHKAILMDENGNPLSKYAKLSDEQKKQKIIDVSNHRRQLKIRGVNYKGGKCCICGYSRYMGTLQFHHYDSKSKSFNISTRNLKSWEKLKEELDKCILVCSNCHAEIESGYINLNDYPFVFPDKCDESFATKRVLKEKHCIDCGAVIKGKAKRCLSCHKRFVARNIPDKDTLISLIKEKSYENIGRMYSVTGKAVKKWCDKYNISKPFDYSYNTVGKVSGI